MTTQLARRTAIATALALLVLAGSSCTEAPTAPRNGALRLLLKDAPGDVSKALVTIERIYLQPDSGSDAGRVILRDTPVTVDLLTLSDSTMVLLDSVAIPAGRYHQLRFVISGGYLEIVASDTTQRLIYASSPAYAALPSDATVDGELGMPSYAQSGLKVKLPGDAVQVDAGGLVTLVVDFNVAQSFGRAAGASGRWVMSPVVEASTAPTP